MLLLADKHALVDCDITEVIKILYNSILVNDLSIIY